jgi:hypothetical protein
MQFVNALLLSENPPSPGSPSMDTRNQPGASTLADIERHLEERIGNGRFPLSMA